MPRWSISFEPKAEKDFHKLSTVDRARVLRFLRDRILLLDDPRTIGKALQADFAGAWRYRVGNVRIIVRLEFDVLVVVVIAVGNPGDVYR